MVQHLRRWLLLLFDRVRGHERYLVARVDERPRWRVGKTLYVVGEPDHPWCAVFTCPCGCGEEVALNLLPDVRPRWEVTATCGLAASVAPSVRRIRGCRSHFHIRRGQVQL